MTELESEDDSGGEGAEQGDGRDDSACIVSEEVASELHTAYLAHQNAKSRYKEAMKGRGYDGDSMKEKAAARLKLAKERSYCSACKKKGHWRKDPECPLNKPGAANRSVNVGQMIGACDCSDPT